MGFLDRMLGGERQEEADVPSIEFTVEFNGEASTILVPIEADLGPSRPRNRKRPSAEQCWVPRGQTATVGSHAVGGGLIYVGTDLAPGDPASWLEAEPALIDPAVPISAAGTDASPLPYAFEFAGLSPSQRAHYLEWLDSDRKPAQIEEAYVELYAGGLERRLLVDLAATQASAERELVIEELRRLSSEAAEESMSLRYSLAQLLNYIHAKELIAGGDSEIEIEEEGWEVPLPTQILIGELAAAGARLPSELALNWCRTSPEAYLRTPAERCPSQFARLFAIRYRERFGDGLELPTVGVTLQLRYRPINRGLAGESEDTGVPDVASSKHLIKPLRELGRDCCSELDPFSRWLGRHADETGSLQAVALLPKPLVALEGSPTIDAIRGLLEQACQESSLWTLQVDSLLEHWDSDRQKLTKKEAVGLVQLVEKLGFGVEPDVRFGAPPFAAEMTAVLFSEIEDDPRAPSAAYAAASALLHLVAAVAAADGSISAEEERHLEAHIQSASGLLPGERQRLGAHTEFLIRSKPSFAGLRKKLEAFEEDERRSIGDSIIAVAVADGQVTPEELKILEKAFDLLGLDGEAIFSEVHQRATESASAEPVTVRPGQPEEAGNAIPAKEPISLNRQRVDAKIAETAMVSSVLASIFEDEEPADALTSSTQTQVADGRLDPRHASFAGKLAERDAWTRVELEQLAGEQELMLDGALETINDAAFEVCELPLTEGEDPIEVDKDIAKDLLR